MPKQSSSLQKKFGMKVRKERLKLGISQEELGFRTGLDRTYISGIERGERNPTLVNIGRIAKGLKIELPELFSFGSP